MKRTASSSLRAVGPWIVIAGIAVVAATAAVAAPPVSVAVVDVMKLLDAHPRKKELSDRADLRQQQARDWAKGENAALEKLKGEIELMTANEPARRQKEKELAGRLVSVKFEIEWRQKEAELEYLRGLDGLYSEVNSVVAKYARDNGIAVVLTKREAADMKVADVNDFGLKVQLRGVVFHDAALDITERVRPLLASAGGAAAPAAPPANPQTPGQGGPVAPPPPPPGSQRPGGTQR
jgi:Skp family chaperone for outer membrane proteins